MSQVPPASGKVKPSAGTAASAPARPKPSAKAEAIGGPDSGASTGAGSAVLRPDAAEFVPTGGALPRGVLRLPTGSMPSAPAEVETRQCATCGAVRPRHQFSRLQCAPSALPVAPPPPLVYFFVCLFADLRLRLPPHLQFRFARGLGLPDRRADRGPKWEWAYVGTGGNGLKGEQGLSGGGRLSAGRCAGGGSRPRRFATAAPIGAQPDRPLPRQKTVRPAHRQCRRRRPTGRCRW